MKILKRLPILIPLALFFLWVHYYNITGGVIWVGFFIAAMVTIGLGSIIVPEETCQKYNMFSNPEDVE